MPEDSCTFGEDFDQFEFCHACNQYDACKAQQEIDSPDVAAVLDIIEAVADSAETVSPDTETDRISTVWERMRDSLRNTVRDELLGTIPDVSTSFGTFGTLRNRIDPERRDVENRIMYWRPTDTEHRIQILPEDLNIRPMTGQSGRFLRHHIDRVVHMPTYPGVIPHECGENCPICEELRERTAETINRNRIAIEEALVGEMFGAPTAERLQCLPYYDLVYDCLTEGIYTKSQLISRVRRSFRTSSTPEITRFVDEIMSSESNVFGKKIHQLRDESLIFAGICPEHGKFGTDIDTLDTCSTCEVYMECDAATDGSHDPFS